MVIKRGRRRGGKKKKQKQKKARFPKIGAEKEGGTKTGGKKKQKKKKLSGTHSSGLAPMTTQSRDFPADLDIGKPRLMDDPAFGVKADDLRTLGYVQQCSCVFLLVMYGNSSFVDLNGTLEA